MADYCFNTITVKGTAKDIISFFDKFKGKPARYIKPEYPIENFETLEADYCLNALVPVPEELLNQEYYPNGYNWQDNNWGTRSDVWKEVHVLSEYLLKIKHLIVEGKADEKASITFLINSIWAPPNIFFKKVAMMFPALSFKLYYIASNEPLEGEILYENGVVVYDIDLEKARAERKINV